MSELSKRLYRITFTAAGIYNLAFGLWTGLFPNHFFDVMGMTRPNYPSIWACLGMVVGIYGFLYFYAARNLDRAQPIIALGLLGKLLGPIGLIFTIRSGEWPMRTITLVAFNDVIWWVPFSLYLMEGSKTARTLKDSAPYACAALNGLATLALFAIRDGTELTSDPALRAAFIAQNLIAWRLCWTLWMMAAVSLLGFYAWWGDRVQAQDIAVVACVICALGMCCDLLGESLYIGWFPEHLHLSRAIAILTAGFANGFYTVAGILLTLKTPGISGGLKAWTWAVWACGIALSVSAFLNITIGIVIASGLLMALFCPWTAYFGHTKRRETSWGA